MKQKSIFKKVRTTANVLLVALLIFQSASLILSRQEVVASTEPQGELKRVIVTYRGKAATSPDTNEVKAEVSELSKREGWLANSLDYSTGYKKVVMSYSQLPITLMEVDDEGEASLKRNPNVLSVIDDEFMKPDAITFEYTPDVLGGTAADGFSDGTTNYTGADTAVVVLDTGVDSDHEAMTGQVVAEACYGINQTYSNVILESACLGAGTSHIAAGAAAPCPTDCEHGTAVASLVAMTANTFTSGGDNFDGSGVAKGAKIAAVQINNKVTEIDGQGDFCGDAGATTEVCYLPIMSLALSGMNWALELQNNNTLGVPIVAVNNSNGIEDTHHSVASECDAADTDGLNVAAAALKAKNIASIASAGNSGATESHYDDVVYPACLSNVIAVSASSATDTISYYSNAGALTDIVAPGGNLSGGGDDDGGLFAAEPDDTYTQTQGTSFASPIAAAAFAVVRERTSDASVDGILAGMQTNGVSIDEERTGYTAITHKRINLAATLADSENFDKFVASTQDEEGSTPTDSDFIPGVPNAGGASRSQAILVIVGSILALGFINLPALKRVRHGLKR